MKPIFSVLKKVVKTYPKFVPMGSSMLLNGLIRPDKADGLTARVGLRLLLKERLGLSGNAAAVSGFGISRGPAGLLLLGTEEERLPFRCSCL